MSNPAGTTPSDLDTLAGNAILERMQADLDAGQSAASPNDPPAEPLERRNGRPVAVAQAPTASVRDMESARALIEATVVPIVRQWSQTINGEDRWTVVEKTIASKLEQLARVYANTCRDGASSPQQVSVVIDGMIDRLNKANALALKGDREAA